MIAPLGLLLAEGPAQALEALGKAPRGQKQREDGRKDQVQAAPGRLKGFGHNQRVTLVLVW